METSMPAGFLAATFQRAFTEIGLPNVRSARQGDTVLVLAGPAVRDTAPAGTQYWARMVAFPHRDSTHFRYYAAVVPPEAGWPAGWNDGGARIGFCGEVGKALALPYSARKDPGGEEQLPVWHHKP
jgi:hypothetical protein